jgi:sulfatase maturation enzyme AslB (radical SAM superfamily)
MIKSWGMTASIPVKGCNKNCPYCISEMTGFVEPNEELIERNLETAYTWAVNSEIDFFLVTSKREPMLEIDKVCRMADRFRKFTVEVQTNGIELYRHPEHLKKLYDNGVNTVAFSIDSLELLHKYQGLFQDVKNSNMMVRVCLNLTDMIPVKMTFAEIFWEIENVGRNGYNNPTGNIRQLLVRNVSIPTNITTGRQYDWIKKHCNPKRFDMLAREFDRIVEKEKKRPISVLPFDGSKTWGHHGISVVFSGYCIQETNNTKDIRSLIYLEDGHMYTSWGDPASILF